MTIPVPLAVRIFTSSTISDVTRSLRGLSFREVAVGGWASAALSLDRSIALPPGELEHYARVVISDERNGQVVWEGRLEDPGRGASRDGQVWQLTAIGPSGHASETTLPLIYVDSDIDAWVRARASDAPGANVGAGDDPGNSSVPSLVMQFPDGMDVTTSSVAAMRYNKIARAGQSLARVSYTWDAGFTSANYAVAADTSVGGGTKTQIASSTASTSGGSASAVVLAPFGVTDDTVDLRLDSNTTETIADDQHWASFHTIVVRTMLYSATGIGNVNGASYSADTVLASEVVADLLGRVLTQYDGANATITATSYGIDQLAWPDGIDARGVLDELLTLETGYRWGAYEANAAGKYRFEFVAWPTVVRYEADAVDGFDSPASADGLFNRVRVRFRDDTGIRTIQRTATSDILTAAGITRTGFLDLGDELGSQANAEQAGDRWLADRITPRNAGSLTISRPIVDVIAGRMVQPWEIKAGELIRVHGVAARPDSLNATSRDGVTVFRIAAKEYEAESASAHLELDAAYATTANLLAEADSGDGIGYRPRRR